MYTSLQFHTQQFLSAKMYFCSTKHFPLIDLLSPYFNVFPKVYIIEIIYVYISDQHISFSIMHLVFLHFFSRLDSSFLFHSEWLFIAWMYNSFSSIHQLKDVLVFEVLAIINKTAINIHCRLLLEYKFLAYLGNIKEHDFYILW